MVSLCYQLVHSIALLSVVCVCCPALVSSASASIVITTLGSTYSQNFDSLASTGATGTIVPAGWTFLETGGTGLTSYGVNDGASNTGNSYSYGTTSSTERAFGSVGSGTVTTIRIGAEFENQTGGTITSLAIQFDGEQWRFGGNSAARPAGTPDTLNFQYSLNASDSDSGTASSGLADAANWIDFDALDFSSLVTSGSASALNGNADDNSSTIFATISSLSIPSGATFWIRWRDVDSAGSDDGLAVDNFSLTARGTLPPTGAVPESSALLVWTLLSGTVLMCVKRLRNVV